MLRARLAQVVSQYIEKIYKTSGSHVLWGRSMAGWYLQQVSRALDLPLRAYLGLAPEEVPVQHTTPCAL